jgi:cyanophycinase
MRQIQASLAIALLFLATASGLFTADKRGALIVVGGGGTPPLVVQRAIELAGGAQSVVAVLPHASAREDRGQGSVEMFIEAGAGEAFLLGDLQAPGVREDLARATLVWMPGGSQNRLMDAVREADLGSLFREMHKNGVSFGGTSAGAAVQSQLMITGKAELEAIVAGGTELGKGLALWPEVIVDQHAMKRKRFNRLLSAVIDQPTKVGVAIDEKTAVIVQGSRFEVLGDSTVLVIDARNAEVPASKPGQPLAASGLSLSVLRAGMGFDLKQAK